jgi:hypothetical protein
MSCLECDRLRSAFQRIVRCNINLLEEYTSAVLGEENGRVERLLGELQDTEARRREARLKLELHEGSHRRNTMAARSRN